MDKVILNQNLSNVCLSEETKSFFLDNGISFDCDSFDLDYLRNLYKQNKTKFYHVLNELSLYGCDYYSSKTSSFFPQSVGKSFEKIISSVNEPFNTLEINELRLWKLFTEYSKRDKFSINGICVERFNAFVGERFNNSDLSKFGFEVIKNEVKIITEEDSNEIKNIWIPKFYLKFISTLWSCDERLINIFKKNNIIYYKDFLKLNERDAEKLVKKISETIDDSYESGLYCFNLCQFLKEKEEFNSILIKNNIDLDYIVSEKSSIRFEIESLIDDFCFFSLKQFDFNLKTFLKINSESGNLYIPSAAINYLGKFNISDLVLLRINIYEKELGFYRLVDLNNSFVSYMYNPYNIFSFIHNEIAGSFCENETEIDNELNKEYTDKYFFQIHNEFLSNYCSGAKAHPVISILSMRNQGLTLEEIGNQRSVTRERVRQIIAKFLERNARGYSYFLSEIFENSSYYSYSQTNKLFGLTEFIESKQNKTDIVFNKNLGIALRQKDAVMLNNYLKEKERDNEFDIFNSSVKINECNLNLSGYLLCESRDIVFNPYPSFYSVKRNSAVDVAYLYLGTKGLKGFDANEDIDDARKFFSKFENDSFEVSNRALIGRIQRTNFVLVGMSRYARADLITENIKQVVKKVLSEYPINKLYGTVAKDIYFAKEKELNQVGVDNYYFLYGVASKWKMCGYTYAGRSMRIFNGKELSLNQIVYKYMQANGPVVASKKICDDLGMREVGFEQVDFLTKYDSDTYVLTKFIQCTKEQYKQLVNFLDKQIDLNGYCLAKELLNGDLFFDSTFNSFFLENLINNSESRLAYAIEVILKRYGCKKYRVSHVIHCVSRIDAPILSTADVAHEHFQDNEFTKEELFEFLDSVELGGDVIRKKILKDYVVKVGTNAYVVSKEYTIDNDEMNVLCSKLDEYYREEISITSNEALNKLAIHNVEHHFGNNPIGFCSAITFFGKGNWVRPRNNLNYDNTKISVILANKRYFPNNSDITISEVIRKTIMSLEKTYMAYNDISEYLQMYEITSSVLPFDVFKQIFAKDIENNGLVRIKK